MLVVYTSFTLFYGARWLSCRLVPALAFAVATFGAFADGALAQTRIGSATAVVPTVSGPSGPIIVGSSIFFNDVIRAAEGETQLRFLDGSNMTIGSGSTIKLDRYVYNPDGTASDFAVSLTKGAFRFASGSSPKGAYSIKTPTATIGLRGTMVLVLAAPGMTSLRVDQGEAFICNRREPASNVRHLSVPTANCRLVPTGGGATVFSNGQSIGQALGLKGVNPGALS
jgi:hypothetical protein